MLLGAIFRGPLSDAAAFSTLLTVESLLFAGMGVALTLSMPQAAIRDTPLKASALGKAIATFISLVALCALLMWTSVFAQPWPCDVRGAIVALVVLVTIVGEAGFAWVVAFALKPKSNVPPAGG
jgi:uncharacterized membrane protein YhaH (DUF805 family)